MLYPYGSLGTPHAEYLKQARAERANVISAALRGVGSLGERAVRALGRVGRTIVSTVVTGHQRRAAMRELEALDDWILKDIGISRSDIPFLVEQRFSAGRTATAGSGTGCEITMLDARKSVHAGPRTVLRPAA
jgi:uncharacterized protein YjiS (DUF1127 family)